jgi:antitoxin component YwqK of YwqJK toxin-antitoxin module
MTLLAELPGPFLIAALQYCNGPDADKAVTLSKKFKNLTIASRKKTVLALAAQPRRVSQEKLPTLLELWQMGIPNPDLTNILHTMKSELPGQLGVDDVITRNTKAHAILQQTQRVFGQLNRLARDAVNGEATDIGQINAQGRTHGFGIRTYQDGLGGRYAGNFRNGQMDGFGYSEFADGGRFEGTYVDGQLNGPGKEFLANGVHFEGTYVNGRANGPGKHFFASGNRIEGTYVDGQLNGPGKKFFANGGRIEGTYVDDRLNGPGKEFFANGDRFEGTYVDGRRNGPGEQFFANGDRIEGIFVNDQRHGQATMFHLDGRQGQCNFVNGQLHGPWIETLLNGEQRTTHYDMGQLVK